MTTSTTTVNVNNTTTDLSVTTIAVNATINLNNSSGDDNVTTDGTGTTTVNANNSGGDDTINAADFALEQIRSLDAGAGFDARFAGTRVPSVAEVVEWAKREEIGVFLEIKEAERPDLAVDRVAGLLEATGTADRAIIIGFDHVVLKSAVERHPGIVTQAITHARHADIVGVLRACRARSVSIELDMFHPDDAKALHDAGYSNRVSLPGPTVFAEYRRGGRDITSSVVPWIAEGLIDTISGDDVPFLAKLVEDAGAVGSR